MSVQNACGYCVSGRSALAAMAGVEPQAVEDLREGRPLADPRRQALRGFAEAVVLIVATRTISNDVNHLTHTPLDDVVTATSWLLPGQRGAV